MATSSSTQSSTSSAQRVRLFYAGQFLTCACLIYTLKTAGIFGALYTGPGSYSRIFATLILALNWKSLPFAWNIRMWHAMILHLFIRDFHTHTPSALFHPVICSSHTSLGEIDYRLHKSNSTYLSDLDIARSHLASHLLARAGHLLARNAKTRILMDPSNPSQPARGPFNIGIGSIYVSFKKEIKPYQQYEMWSRVLSWDKKWLYILTHFIQKGAAKPRSWDAEYCGPLRTSPGEGKDWEKKIYTTAVTTYVFKLGRLTIHPAIMLGESGLLPTRPGGWVVDPDTDCVLDGSEMPEDGELMEWTWQRTESERRKGMQIARHVAALSDLHTRFDSGEDGALGYFPLG